MRNGVTNAGARDGVAATLLDAFALPLLLPAPQAADKSCSRAVSCARRSLTWEERAGLAAGADASENGEGAGWSDAISRYSQDERE